MAQNALTSIAGNVVKDPIAVIVGVCVLVAMDWRFSLTTLVLFPVCIVPVMIFGKKVRKAGTAEENEAGTMAVILQESFAGVRVIKSFAREDYQIAQFEKSSAVQCHNSMKVRRSTDIVQPLIESVSACGVVLASVVRLLLQHQLHEVHCSLLGDLSALQSPEVFEQNSDAHAEVPRFDVQCLRPHAAQPSIQDAQRDGDHRMSWRNKVSRRQLCLRTGLKALHESIWKWNRARSMRWSGRAAQARPPCSR